MVTRLLLLLVLLGSGTLPWDAPVSGASAFLDEPSVAMPVGGLVSSPVAVPDGDELRVRLPEGPAALVAGSGVSAPASTLRAGLNHRSGLQLDPDGTPSRVRPGLPSPPLDGGESGRAAHRSPFRAVPLFSSSIPPPHLV